VIRVYDEAGNVVETHDHKDDLEETVTPAWNKKPPRDEAWRL